VEPSAYTKVSALGVDEQRVWVTIALAAGSGTTLGHGYRVEVRIVVWAEDNVLLAPAGAVFRCGTGWGAYRVNRDGRTEFVEIEIGKRNPSVVETRGGLEPGDRLVMHPGDRVGERNKSAGAVAGSWKNPSKFSRQIRELEGNDDDSPCASAPFPPPTGQRSPISSTPP